MKFKPLSDRVLLSRVATDEKTPGGLYVPDIAKEKPVQARVMAVGPGKDGRPMTVAVGDMVLFGKYAGSEVKLNGEDFVLMGEEDLLGVIET